ncbi:uncharacterized protein SOCE26_049410 [Sorangium cellulosum]|uniref:Secreted protein n=1 Tax=Sorangium cellulosum TaxID=56 RepID=A0A2L0EW41_SORCE|nr:hypothetical protein [Sorangium cellulosum]AUX43492.1 uncharacterized protein SOCE26_049410 [Sorangium cellulosum]
MRRLVHIALCSVMLSLGIGCMVAADPAGEPERDGEVAAEVAGEELVGESDEAVVRGIPAPCGTTSCGSGTFCCNSSCGICAPLGGSCTQQYCPPLE